MINPDASAALPASSPSRAARIRQTGLLLAGLAAAGVLAASLWKGDGLFPPAARAHPLAAAACLAAAGLVAWWPRLARMRVRIAAWVFDSAPLGFHLGLGLLAWAGFAAAAWWVLGGVPRLDDSVAAVWQARVFAAGHLRLPLPEHGEFFRVFGVLGWESAMGHWMTFYPPGWSALLVPFVWLGVTWLAAPFFGAGLVVMTALAARELFDPRAGRVAGLLALASPFVAALSATHLTHVPTACFLVLCLWATLRLIRIGAWRYGVLAGSAWSVAFLCRPLTALVVGAAFALWPLANWRRALAVWPAVLLALLLAGTGIFGLAAWQKAVTGDPFTPGHEIGMGRRGKMGFVRLDWARTHTPALGLEFSLKRMRVVNDELLGWPLPALLIVLWPFLRGRWGGREAWLLAPWFGLLGVYAAYWYWESCYPARYTFCAMPMLLMLAARALTGPASEAGVRLRRRPALILLAGGLIFSLGASLPLNFARFTPLWGDVERLLPGVVGGHGITNAVVFLAAHGRSDEGMDDQNDYYATGFRQNTLDLQGDIVYARDLRGSNLKLMHAYPGRRYYRYVLFRDRGEAVLTELREQDGRLVSDPVPHVGGAP
jgi:hypothetical protein